eukprot:m.158859 g.158859  ORF g.158859 m.158859 type:complete len:93 (+) comp23703_c0_seq3:62-340(+)
MTCCSSELGQGQWKFGEQWTVRGDAPSVQVQVRHGPRYNCASVLQGLYTHSALALSKFGDTDAATAPNIVSSPAVAGHRNRSHGVANRSYFE